MHVIHHAKYLQIFVVSSSRHVTGRCVRLNRCRLVNEPVKGPSDTISARHISPKALETNMHEPFDPVEEKCFVIAITTDMATWHVPGNTCHIVRLNATPCKTCLLGVEVDEETSIRGFCQHERCSLYVMVDFLLLPRSDQVAKGSCNLLRTIRVPPFSSRKPVSLSWILGTRVWIVVLFMLYYDVNSRNIETYNTVMPYGNKRKCLNRHRWCLVVSWCLTVSPNILHDGLLAWLKHVILPSWMYIITVPDNYNLCEDNFPHLTT